MVEEEVNSSKDNVERGMSNYKTIERLAQPLIGEEIVISGISGTFPKSRNIQEYADNLFNKVNMVLPNRWDFQHSELPPCSGIILEVDKYDTGFFGVHERQSQSMDAMCRKLQENVLEAIFDSGLHPSDLENTKTGVFVGACMSESEVLWCNNKTDPQYSQYYALTGLMRNMLAHRVSYFLKLRGPSYVLDTACSTSLYAVEHAYRAIRSGEIDSAIVAGTNMCMVPGVSIQFQRLGVLSKDAKCKVFSNLANGYVRSEATTAILLQKSKTAKRVFAQIIHGKTNCDGFKEEGITYPSGLVQRELLKEVYDECGIDRYSLSFLEAHGTGTRVGDPEECSAVDGILTKNRTTPLLIGSVKSNIGHTESASGLCSIAKCIIAMETGFIPPNINYTEPNTEIKGILEGRLKVVTEKMPFEDNRGLIGTNSFGFGGANCHILLRWNPKTKVHGGIPEDNLPRLVCISGRTEEAVTSLLDQISNTTIDVEYIALLHNIFRKDIPQHLYRGYSIVSKSGEVTRSIKKFTKMTSLLYLAFGEMHNWHLIGNHLIAFPVFAISIQRIQNYLSNKGINVIDLLFSREYDRELYNVVGSIAVQIGIIDILNLLKLTPVDAIGYSFGEILSAYYKGMLTLEETLDCAVVINDANRQCNTNCNGFQHHEQQNGDPTGAEKLENLKNSLRLNKSEKIRDRLFQNLKDILNATPSNKKTLYNAKYIINSLLNNSFQNIYNVSEFPNSIVLEIGTCPVDDFDEKITVISLGFNSENYVTRILECLGSLYENGCQPQVSKLYPSVSFPVSRGTPMISSYIKWKHTRELFFIDGNSPLLNRPRYDTRSVKIQIEDRSWSYIAGHVIDGRNLFPAAGYLYLVWETLALINDIPMFSMKVVLENCKFVRATTILKKDDLTFWITVKSTGDFKVIEGDSPLVTGRITMLDPDEREEQFVSKPVTLSQSVTLKSKDVYKELRLRGYNYRGAFRAIQEFDTSTSRGGIEWEENWVTFIDNMLQVVILQTDSRLLYVPTYIARLTINAKMHTEKIKTKYMIPEKPVIVPVYSNAESGIISAGGIWISGLIASSVSRKRDVKVPVLEEYKFVPNITTVNIEQSIRVNTQIILENALVYKVKAIELIDEFTTSDALPLTPIILSVLGDQPLIQPNVKILSKAQLNINVEIENKELKSETNCLLIVASNILTRLKILQDALDSLVDEGFILSRESLDFESSQLMQSDITLLTEHTTQIEKLVLLRKQAKAKPSHYITVSSSDNFSWVSEVQGTIKRNANDDIVLCVENEHNSGIIGLVNCLRREPESKNVKCVYVMNTNERYSQDFYVDQLNKNMAINVYRNGQWGTYRHLLLEALDAVESEHCYVNVTTKGDLSSLRWIEGPLHRNMSLPAEKELIQVYYAALNFRDVMTASGKINADIITRDRIEQDCVQGIEFSGRDEKGNRVMGMVSQGALSTVVMANPYFTFKVPDSWTMEEAATVSVVYGTVIYGLFIRGQLKKDESILIHSGTGGIGQAAIRLALHHGCTVYTTVGTQAKREFLKKMYPQLTDSHIGNSRDESFEQMIYSETNSKGVDMVLNSLAEEKLIASVKCLARGGRFIEIGKFDLLSNASLNLLLLEKEASFVGTMLDQMFTESPKSQIELRNRLREGMENGSIKPLNRTIFQFNEVEQAFRFMAKGQHTGKILIQIREPENELIFVPPTKKFLGIPRYSCNPEKTYVIVGGLGGFGLELADWLVLRGAKQLVLTSRKGISTGYQNHRIRLWSSYGTFVKISNADVTTKDGCKQLIEQSKALGPIEAIFNLAVVLADAVFENQTPESFMTSFKPKAVATMYLDELTREMCPDLSEFVIFSSVSCGRGNAGQTNYGMANSVMERICEKRKQDGYPALAIEWGAIGDVGLVAELQEEHTELEISGTLQQPIASCLRVLDTLLKHKSATLISSMVVAEKRAGSSNTNNIVDTVLDILGVPDIKSVSQHSTLAELGMDSMTAVEIKQTLERDYEVFLTAKDIRSLTVAGLKETQEHTLGENAIEGKKEDVTKYFELDMVLRFIGEESEITVPSIRLKSAIDENAAAPKVLLFPGIEGFSSPFKPLASRLNAHIICIQFTYGIRQVSTVSEIAEELFPLVEQYLEKNEQFTIVAYSFGVLVALEVVHILESRGYDGTLICLDGAPFMMERMGASLRAQSENTFQSAVIWRLLALFSFENLTAQHKENLFNCKSWEDRLNYAADIVKSISTHNYNYLKLICNGIYYRLKATMKYTSSFTKLKSTIKLFKAKQQVVHAPEDYELSQICEKPVEVNTFEGSHYSLLQNEKLAETINSFLQGAN